MENRIQRALRYTDNTRMVVIEDQALSQTDSIFQSCFGDKKAIIIADPTTFRLAGQTVNEVLKSNIQIQCEEPFLFDSAEIHAEMKHIETLKTVLARTDAIPVAVGSGTVNDLTKYASSLFQRPYMIVGTAASMDGFTSFGASIEYNFCKQTFNCPAPTAVLIDMDVICDAPIEMNASGYADLIAKIPAAADWILADLIGTEPIDPVAWNLVQGSLKDWLNYPQGIVQRDRKSLRNLIEGLIMSGLAMQKAKSSRTASGAEHQFSHLWDNQNHRYQGRTPSHGFKVGIGTIATSALYEKVLKFDSSVFLSAIETLPRRFRSWEQIEQKIDESFKETGLNSTVRKQCQLKFVDQTEIKRRLQLFYDNWDEILLRLKNQLLDAQTIQSMICQSSAPSLPEEIGIDRPRLLTSYSQAQLLRCRYNVLDWMIDLGLWEDCVESLFKPGGFWFGS
ncbi:MAG: sn-glycerol-1-phosphate dehydrogenase [Planctomycetia bacterium]|nr:sn-glycerol-1-phosphate dehydrogenase [Planctomycetia bacterium]